ncbi:MAG: metal-dependent hydrolase, partial [Pirellulales bacterium]|nr:metal-dependent hydrolase [Pirellulales bacterium]
MAGFKTHVTISSLAGIGYGGVAHWLYGVPIPTCALAGGLCAVSGMLPDIDSDSGRPLRESMAFAAAIVPMMLLERLARFKLPTETTVLFGAFIYLAIRFGFAGLLKKFTTH